MSDDVRTCYHESGHALVALALRLPVALVTIVRDDASGTLGRVALDDAEPDNDAPTQPLTAEQRAAIGVAETVWTLAGAITERIAFGSEGGGCWRDLQEADGATERVDDAKGTHRLQWRPQAESAVESYLREHWPLVSKLAVALLNERTLTGARALEIVGAAPSLDLRNVEGAVCYWSARMAARTKSA